MNLQLGEAKLGRKRKGEGRYYCANVTPYDSYAGVRVDPAKSNS